MLQFESGKDNGGILFRLSDIVDIYKSGKCGVLCLLIRGLGLCLCPKESGKRREMGRNGEICVTHTH